MTSNPRKLALAIAAVAAIGAVTASPAQAVPKFMAGSYPATLTAEQVAPYWLFSVIGETECKQVIGHGTLSSASTALVLEPAFSECTTENGFVGVTIKVNGCKLQFRVEEEIPEIKDKWRGKVDVVCPPAKVVELVVGTACTVKVASQENISPIYFEDMTAANPEDIRINTEAGAIAYSYSGLACGSGSSGGGAIWGESTVKADDVSTNPLALKVQ